MESDTTTSDTVDSGVDETELDDTEVNTGAVNEDEDTSQADDTDESGSDEDNSEDTELKDWAAKKNLPLDDPIKMAKIIRDSEKELGKRTKEGQLKNAVTSANESNGTEDYQALRDEVAALSFFVNNPDAKQYESTMVEILEDDRTKYLASDLQTLLEVARGRSMTDAATRLQERNAGKKEGREAAEQAGRAAQPRVSARSNTTVGKITPSNVDAMVGAHAGDVVWYKKNLPAINAALAG